VTVDRTPPELRAPHRVARANDPGVCSALIRRLGQPDATDDVEIASVVNDAPADQRFSVGRTVVTWTATDTGGNASTDRQLVRVIDREPPRISALRLDRPLSLPRKPELEWVEAHVSYTLADNCSPTSALRVNLYVESAGAGVHARGRDQWNEHAESSQVASPLRVLLRADKGSRGFDAFYTITLRVRDEAGNAMSKSLSVKVPKWTHGR
jgi:hypothetical protein